MVHRIKVFMSHACSMIVCVVLASFPLYASALEREEALAHVILWHAYQGDEQVALEKIVERYNQQHADEKVKVKAISIDFEIYQQALQNHLPYGKGPDLFIAPHDPLGRWVEAQDMLEPMDYVVAGASWLGRFPQPAIDAVTYKDRLYGIPLNFKVPTLIYNRELVQQLPDSFAAWVAFSKAFSDVTEQRYGLLFEYQNLYFHSAFANAFKMSLFNSGVNTPNLSQAALVDSYRYIYQNLVQPGLVPSSVSHAYMQRLFNQGKVAAVISGPWFLNDVNPNIELGFTTLPVLDEEHKALLMPWSTVEAVFISRSSQYKYQAADFVEYLTNLDSALLMAQQGHQLPSNSMVYPLPELKDVAALQAFKAQMEQSIPMPNNPLMSAVWSPVSYAMQQVQVGTSLERAFNLAQQKLEHAVRLY